MSPLILCPKCGLYVTPKPQFINNYDTDPAYFVCEKCGWKLTNAIKKAQEANSKRC
jgi:hypothetical protein